MPKTPAFTTATAWRSPLTGVGATMAEGSQPWSGTMAAFTAKPARRRIKARRANAGARVATDGAPPAAKSREAPIPARRKVPARIATPPERV